MVDIKMNEVTEKLLKEVAGISGKIKGAFNIREDSGCAGRQNSENIKIKSKTDKPGIDIHVKENTPGEYVYIPACVTKSGVKDLVYNDFHIGDNADVVIVAGCGISTDEHGDSQHDGIHRFFVGKNAKVKYLEKHIGIGEGTGKRIINPVTEIFQEAGSYVEIDTTQIKGVDSTNRITTAELDDDARLVIKEKLMTHGVQDAITDFVVDLNGENSGADLMSRSVARDKSTQSFISKIYGNNACKGHSECDAIIMDEGKVTATPELTAADIDAELIHEAAIGKIAGEQIIKLMTLGLTSEEAEQTIINGFLK